MMNSFKYLICFFLMANVCIAQDIELPPLSSDDLSPKIQSPLYQTFDNNEFELLVRNVNVFASSKNQKSFDFVHASAAKERKYSYVNYYEAVNRQMSQFSNFKVEINNSKSSPFIDYHDEPIYSGSFRVKNSAYQNADRLTGSRLRPLLYSPSLSARRGLIWY